MVMLRSMSGIEFEDRTQESPELTVTRQVEAVSSILIGTTIAASQGNASVGLGALALALGQGAARTGAVLDDVLDAVRKSYETGLEQLAEQASRRVSDA
jgi:hypothetical protein